MNKMKNIILIILAINVCLSKAQDKSTDINLVTNLRITLEGNMLLAHLNIKNTTSKPIVIGDSSLGLCDANNLINKFLVVEERRGELAYIGIVDHTTGYKHNLNPGEEVKSVVVLNGIYNFESVRNKVKIQYRHEVLDDQFLTIKMHSNFVLYNGGALPFIEREQLVKNDCE
jgi:protease II